MSNFHRKYVLLADLSKMFRHFVDLVHACHQLRNVLRVVRVGSLMLLEQWGQVTQTGKTVHICLWVTNAGVVLLLLVEVWRLVGVEAALWEV